ncbi:MAG: class I SAM-dependent methyltransferase [Deltaproteobacteria bacterium]|jgi:SAM-dependent methyltransferase|nr:class I SAM-dependent methyltransferase [Deltaproteobacteria bacterium]MBW2543588.1 class I SAM-dependent methyltransferase [Deltaproteobacteria bacterium]
MTKLEVQAAGGDTGTPLNLQKRLDWISAVAGPLDGKRAIDCGCGAGEYVRALTALGADTWGIEYSAEKVDEAKRLGGLPDGRVAVGDIEALDFPDAHFDLALVNEVLEHVPNEELGIREVHRVLKPGGVAVIFSPNRLYPFETHGVSLRSGAKVPHYTPLVPWVPVRFGLFEYWARNYWPWELRALVRAGGFTIERCAYVWQTFENISGNQPRWIRALRPLLRAIAHALEATPGLRAFGGSQLIVARKPHH